MLKPMLFLTALRRTCTRTGAAFAVALLCLVPLAIQAQVLGATVKTDQVRAELLAHAPQGIQAGQTFWLGLQIQHQPHWHTYWQNPGDSGLPTRLQWKLPTGLQAGDIAWPLPKKIPIGTLANYGYEGAVMLPVPVTVGPDFKAPVVGPVKIQLQAEWLVCRQECVPQEGQFELSLPAQGATALHGALFDAAQKQSPQTLAGAHQATVSADGRTLTLSIEALPSAWRGQTLSLFPVTANVVNNAAVQGQTWTQSWQGARWTAQMPVSDERSESPTHMTWVIAAGPESAPRAPAVEVTTPVSGTWPALATASPSASVSPALAKALADNAKAPTPQSGSWGSLVLAVLGAFVGGLLLNLMPCVFPVLAIKVLGFAQPGHGRAEHRAAGLAYTVGVVISFLLLGGLLLGLRAAGEQLGWGFQLQSPVVVAGLALLFTLLGLNLAGVFEFGQMVPSRLASWQSRHTTVNAGLSGVLAVAVASPCTAPFMGTSLGLAIALPAWQALAVFVAMGLGMALPYLAASFWPAVARALPRPGAWMVVFRQAMAFPMFATVIWLLWVLGQQTGIDGASGLLATLLCVAWLAWAWGLQGRARWVLSVLALGALTWLAVSVLPMALREAPSSPMTSNEAAPRWQAWSEARVQSELAAGRPVFVDFTAAWCVTCQYNKKTTLADAGLLADFDARQVVLMRADWTRRDAAITQALTALGRSGVPVYALYAPGRAPVLLSELPSVAEVQQALRGL
ncbi:protein-disulfide reductase [Limnohabitans sp. Jir72]|nr:protein-disulfide reductase [Limnohabitans sp. Jir72]